MWHASLYSKVRIEHTREVHIRPQLWNLYCQDYNDNNHDCGDRLKRNYFPCNLNNYPIFKYSYLKRQKSVLFCRFYLQKESVHFLILIKESRTGHNPKITMGSERSVFGFFFFFWYRDAVWNSFYFYLPVLDKPKKEIYPLYLCGLWALYKMK